MNYVLFAYGVFFGLLGSYLFWLQQQRDSLEKELREHREKENI